ncbi:MAG TPA: hypothetical protein VI776_15885 [Anaerolineales bacterium]|nr:hypothetical protein [Anaerolineales bacterium]
MKEYIYPTRANTDDEWARDMLNAWEKSRKPLLCFPWILFNVHTLVKEPFWMYLYYTVRATDIPALQGKVEFRVRVIDWSLARFQQDSIYPARYEEDGKVWFLCERYEEIRNAHQQLLSLDDFAHATGKNLISTIRNSIPQVICHSKVIVAQCYP